MSGTYIFFGVSRAWKKKNFQNAAGARFTLFFGRATYIKKRCTRFTPKKRARDLWQKKKSIQFTPFSALDLHFPQVHKVKTIGDAYLAVAGLPGQEQDNCCMAMLNFAACCAQIFGSRFCHPNQGDILLAIASRNMLNKKKKTVRLASASEAEGPADGDAAAPGAHSATAQCAMRYGIAAGPLTAGVLQGKTPMFDIWGKTVNLASRMESTGVSGRIQVSELVYRSVRGAVRCSAVRCGAVWRR